jgi:hypothetical protein
LRSAGLFLVPAWSIQFLIEEPLTLCGKEIPVNVRTDSVKYLAFPIGGNRDERSVAGNATLTEMRLTIDKMTKSPLFVAQRIQASRTYVSPRIDFLLLNSDVLKSDLRAFDEHMHGEVQKCIGGRAFQLLFSTCNGRTVTFNSVVM